jgi:ABC-type lipoprotein release transport system permease subunit
LSFLRITKILFSKKSYIPLLLILIASSAAFSISLSILLSTRVVGASILGESSGIITVTSGVSRTPISGDIPLALVGTVSGLNGIELVSPEVLAPSTISNISVMVRGVDPLLFDEIQKPKIVSGSLIQENETTNEVMIGEFIASEANLHVGSNFTISGSLAAASVPVEVKGIFQTGTSIDDEVIGPIWLGQWLRGFGYDTVSVLRVLVNKGENLATIENEVQDNIHSATNTSQAAEPPIQTYLPTSSLTSSELKDINLIVSGSTSSQFLSTELGLSEESVWLLAILVFLSMSLAVVYAFQETVQSVRLELGTLRAVGMSYSILRRDLVLAGVLLAIAAGILGWILGIGLLLLTPGLNPFVIAFYSVTPTSASLSALAGASVAVLFATLISAVVASSEFSKIAQSANASSEMDQRMISWE